MVEVYIRWYKLWEFFMDAKLMLNFLERQYSLGKRTFGCVSCSGLLWYESCVF